jgi:hypothetical protein
MKLPNGDRAIVPAEKLRDYCLNPQHPVGGHKARVFASSLGLAATDADVLREALLLAARTENTIVGRHDAFGQRYTIDFIMTTAVGAVTVRSSWIIRAGETKPRLTSCYVR